MLASGTLALFQILKRSFRYAESTTHDAPNPRTFAPTRGATFPTPDRPRPGPLARRGQQVRASRTACHLELAAARRVDRCAIAATTISRSEECAAACQNPARLRRRSAGTQTQGADALPALAGVRGAIS